ncbi:MAG: hypothetical protein ACM30G_20735 [Micromonosporaceae bacterium]
MTLPTQQIPHVSRPTAPRPRRRLPRPIALGAVMVFGTILLTVCLIAVTFSGLFGNPFRADRAEPAIPTLVTVGPVPAALATEFDDGTWLVGRDIVAGTYQASVPASSAGCMWERADSSDGTLASVLESGAGDAGTMAVVTIKVTDTVFRSHECGRWVQVAGAN